MPERKNPTPADGRSVLLRLADPPAWAQGIRALYDATRAEPLPPDLLALLDQLEHQVR